MTGKLSNRIAGDKALAHQVSRGDLTAFDELFRRYHRPIYGFCAAMVGSEEAKDILQNVMSKAMTSMPDNEDFRVKPWLYRVARNECLDYIRSARRTETGLDADSRSDDSGRREPHRAAVGRERLAQLVDDVNELPDKQRSALVMRELSGLSYAEIAASIGSSGDGAKQLVYEARLALEQQDLGRKLDCAEVRESISALDRRRLRGRKIRAHLRSCAGCAGFERAIGSRRDQFRSLIPALPVGVAAGMLDVIREAGSAGGAAAGVSGGVAAGGIASGVAVKGVAALVVAGALGAGAAEYARQHRDVDPAGSGQGRAASTQVPPGLTGVAAADRPRGRAGEASPGGAGREAGADGRRDRPGSRQDRPGHAGGGSDSAPGDTGSAERNGGIRLTPGQGGGEGPAELPTAAANGQSRASQASSAVPGKTGGPSPSKKPAAPPGQAKQAPDAGAAEPPPALPAKAAPAPVRGRPDSQGKSGK